MVSDDIARKIGFELSANGLDQSDMQTRIYFAIDEAATNEQLYTALVPLMQEIVDNDSQEIPAQIRIRARAVIEILEDALGTN